MSGQKKPLGYFIAKAVGKDFFFNSLLSTNY